jgi:hypothetical protein
MPGLKLLFSCFASHHENYRNPTYQTINLVGVGTPFPVIILPKLGNLVIHLLLLSSLSAIHCRGAQNTDVIRIRPERTKNYGNNFYRINSLESGP